MCATESRLNVVNQRTHMPVASPATRPSSSWAPIIRRFRVEADRSCLCRIVGQRRAFGWMQRGLCTVLPMLDMYTCMYAGWSSYDSYQRDIGGTCH